MRKSKLFAIALCVCLGLCACQASDEGVSTSDAPTEGVKPTEQAYLTLTPENTDTVEPTEAPQVTPEAEITPTMPQTFDETISAARVVVDGIVHTCDIFEAGEQWYISAEDANGIFGVSSEDNHVALDAYAKEKDISYEQDTVLNAAYFSTWEPYRKDLNRFDFERAIQLDLASEELRERKTEQISSAEFRKLLTNLIQKLNPDMLSYFDEKVTEYETKLSRGQGFMMAFYAAKCIGADYFYNGIEHDMGTAGDFWDCNPADFEELVPYTFAESNTCGYKGEEPNVWGDTLTAAYLWAFGQRSPVSGNLMFTFDEETGTMNQKGVLTIEEAVSVLARLYDGAVGAVYVSASDIAVTEGFTDHLSAELREKMQEAPVVTAENHPVWTGLSLGFAFDRQVNDYSKELRLSANWGFNSARALLDYEPFFDSEVTKVNMTNLQILDELVKTAIQYNVHLNICFSTLPGREAYSDPDTFTSIGVFDLFINEEKQEQVNRLWAALAKRYAEVPSAYLSFTPFWEATNNNLSTGLPAPDYTMEDIGNYLVEVVEAIREQDEERLVIYEPTSGNGYNDIYEQDSAVKECIKDVENIMISYNFCENPYVYANMTDTPGENIDNNNRSVFLPEYPTYFYSVGWNVDEEHPITFTGFLPEGTVVDIYLKESWDATLNLSADGEIIFSEYIEKAQFETSNPISIYYQYATSEKKISVTLEEKVDELVLFCNGFGVAISGIDVRLLEEYAVERWYTATTYDVYMGYEEEAGVTKRSTSRIMISPNEYNYLTNIEILEDVSFKTGKVWAEASKETIEQWGKHISEFDGNCMVRYEGGCFNGAVWEDMSSYYQDLLDMFVKNGFSWWSGDLYWMTNDHTKSIAEAPSMPYSVYPYFNIELLKLLQEHQNSERVPGTQAVEE